MASLVASSSAKRIMPSDHSQSENLSLAFEMRHPLQTLYGEAVRSTPEDMLALLAQIDILTDDALPAWEQLGKSTVR